MASITSDGHTFSIDGQRFWMVAGTMHYARIPAGLWGERLLAARQAGINTIETPVVWGLHERLKGTYDFSGEKDLPSFIRLAGDLGMKLILRVGPAVGAGYDLGGLPSWIIPECERNLRTNNPEFLACCSSFFSALGSKVKKFQVTQAGARSGPLIAIQAEHGWYFDKPDLADAYLGQLSRYLRESGFNVPILNRNNLFAGTEGELSTWSGYSDLMAVTRQLRVVLPDQPPIVMGMRTSARDVWGQPTRSAKTPNSVLRAAAQVLAAGGQFCLDPLHAGTHFAFNGGRLEGLNGGYAPANPDSGAPLTEAGVRTDLYHALRRLCVFTSTFSRVFTQADGTSQPATIAPDAILKPNIDEDTGARTGRTPPGNAGLSVAHLRGAGSSVVFVFGNEDAKPRQKTQLLLTDGTTLPIDLGGQSVAWVLLNTHLAGKAHLDFSNLNAFTQLGKVFVCYGPAGSTGMLSISSTPFEIVVPAGRTPAVEEHEGLSVVVCNETQIDATYFEEDEEGNPTAVLIGVAGIDAQGEAIAHKDFPEVTRIDPDGNQSTLKLESVSRTPGAPKLEQWRRAGCEPWIDGTDDRYALIDGPGSMESLGAPNGYGWVRIKFKSSTGKKARLGAFESGDRVGWYCEGEFAGVSGHGPGAEEPPIPMSIKKGDNTLVGLVDNLGRYSDSTVAGHPKGIYGHLYDATLVKGTPKIVEDSPADPTLVRTPVFGLHQGDGTHPARLTWEVTHRRKSPLILTLPPMPTLGVVILNDEPIELAVKGEPAFVLLDQERLNRGKNVIQIALMAGDEQPLKELKQHAKLYEGKTNFTEGAQWAFSKWEMPPKSRFEKFDDADLTPARLGRMKGVPVWWTAKFSVEELDRPLYFDAAGLSKGQLFLNGENLCRYFVQTHDGKDVPPQRLYYLPGPRLKGGAVNELTFFDEHGFGPSKCRLTHTGP